ncbi:ADP-ribosylglycohydrolase [Eubacterium ruminantium]|nr:ADP-ribosylglycohydrolase [Eubacterium ruminantium]
MEKNIWLDGVMGVVVGDALGCPVQFMSREKIANRPQGPVTGMESYGTYNMPEGTWTDDSSMTLATLSSIIDKGEANPVDIMTQFLKWEFEGEYTPFGEAFDEGNTCSTAIYRFRKVPDIKTCGCTGERSNGNGSLMRIMPACLYYYDKQQKTGISNEEVIKGIHTIGGLTHNHIRSLICCGIYFFMVKNIVDGCKKNKNPELGALLQAGIDEGLKMYGKNIENLTELAYMNRLFHLYEFKDTPAEKIRTTGYVIDTIEAAVWCLITSDSFRECLLKAVNLGDDTDTVGAIAGGLAGLYYGYKEIPDEWLSVIQRREWIEELCNKGRNVICNRGSE